MIPESSEAAFPGVFHPRGGGAHGGTTTERRAVGGPTQGAGDCEGVSMLKGAAFFWVDSRNEGSDLHTRPYRLHLPGGVCSGYTQVGRAR